MLKTDKKKKTST